MSYTLGQLCDFCGGVLHGDGLIKVDRLATIKLARSK